jgi:hypothetical protein
MLLIPTIAKAGLLTLLTDIEMKLRIYANNKVPSLDDILADYTEVSGGGYNEITLEAENWSISGTPIVAAIYNEYMDFVFTGATSGTHIAYGYYLVQGTILMGAERFSVDPPIEPSNGTLIRVRPVFALSSLP